MGSKGSSVCTTAACSDSECCKAEPAPTPSPSMAQAQVSIRATKQMYDDIITVAGKQSILADCTTKHSSKGLTCIDGRRGSRRRRLAAAKRKLATYMITIT